MDGNNGMNFDPMTGQPLKKIQAEKPAKKEAGENKPD